MLDLMDHDGARALLERRHVVRLSWAGRVLLALAGLVALSAWPPFVARFPGWRSAAPDFGPFLFATLPIAWSVGVGLLVVACVVGVVGVLRAAPRSQRAAAGASVLAGGLAFGAQATWTAATGAPWASAAGLLPLGVGLVGGVVFAPKVRHARAWQAAATAWAVLVGVVAAVWLAQDLTSRGAAVAALRTAAGMLILAASAFSVIAALEPTALAHARARALALGVFLLWSVMVAAEATWRGVQTDALAAALTTTVPGAIAVAAVWAGVLIGVTWRAV